MPYEILEDEAPAKPAGGYEILDADPAEAPGTLEGIANSFQRGNLAGQRAIEALQFKDEKPTMRQGRRAFVGAMEDPRYSYGLLDDPAKMESLLGPAARLDRMTAPAREFNIATAGNIAGLSKQMESIPQSAAMQEWSTADNSNWWQVFARNPVEITANIFAESLPQASTGMVAGMAGGLAGGPAGAAAGAGTGSFVVEASNAFLEGAAKSGVNLQDPEQVRAFFADEAKVKEARQFALQRGFPVALFDALTAGVAGKFLKPMLGRGVGRVAAASGAEAGVQMAGGAAGEAAAQVASGQELNAKDIFAEAVGELVTTPGEVVTNLRTELKGFDVLEDVATSGTTAISGAKPATDLQPKAPPAVVTPDAMAELQAVLRGEAPGSQRLKGALPKVQPDKTAGVASEPVVVEKRVEVPAPLTEEQRAAIEFQKRTDEAVARELANPDKNYEGMGRLELELLEGMGDARATAALRRMRARATEQKFLESLKPPEAKPREEYAAMTEEERPDSLRTVVDATDRVAAPPLQAAIDAMKAGKPARQVVSEWGGGRGEHDALIDILEQINVAREEKALSELGALRKAYLKAFSESARPNVDTALKHLASARDTQGFAPAGGVPEDAGTLYRRLFDEATGQRSEKPTAQALELYFLDTVTSKEGRTKQQRGADPVALDTLHVGDKFRLRGVEMTVTAIDPDTDAVTFRAADAEQFGTSQTLTPSMANEIYPDFGSFRKSKAISEGLNWPETEAPQSPETKSPAANVQKGTEMPAEAGASPAPEPAANIAGSVAERPSSVSKDAIESALDKLKIELPPGSLQAFGLIPEIWNGLIETVRLAYRGGKTIAAAIEDGLAWLKATHGEQQFDESAVRAELQNIVEGEPSDKPAGLRAQLNNLQAEMQAIEARGEEIPQAMLDEYKDLADTLGDEIRAGRAPSGAGRVKVDENLSERGTSPRPSPQSGEGENRGGRPSSIPQWKGEERLPGGRLKDLFTGLKNWRERAGNWLARRGTRETVTMNRDVADNRANQAANAASLRVRLILNRAFDTAPGQVRVKHDIREAALTFVVEADGNQSALSDFYDQIAASEHADTKAGRQALAALEYAEAHWEKFQPAAAEYKTLTETEREAELNEGVNSHEWKGGYVKHSWDRESPGTGADPTVPAAAGTPFRKPRSVATYAEGIAQGRKPTTLNALELLADRVASGQRKLNELSWVHGLRNMIDPVTEMPVVVDTIRREGKAHKRRRGLLAHVQDAQAAIAKLEPDMDNAAEAWTQAQHRAGKWREALAGTNISEEEILRLMGGSREEALLEASSIEQQIDDLQNQTTEVGTLLQSIEDNEYGEETTNTPEPVQSELRAEWQEYVEEIRRLKKERKHWKDLAETRPTAEDRRVLDRIDEQRAGLSEEVAKYHRAKIAFRIKQRRRNNLRSNIEKYQKLYDSLDPIARKEAEWIVKAPEGYSVWRMGELEVAVQENFVGLLNKLTAASFFKGAAAKKVFGFIKSSLLMFDTFHLGRMVAWRQMFGLGGGYRKGQTLLDFSTADIREMAARGEIPESWADGLIENKRRLDLALRTGFNVGNVLDNAWGDALHHLPVVGTFNHWLFGQYQRGAMAEAWLIEFERMSKAMPKATEAQVARRVSKDLNARFGNLNRQGLFKSRTAQDLVRFFFLAPQWNESLIRAELGAIGQTLKAPLESVQQRRLVVGTLMKATGAMALGTFLANQILNYAFRGKPTWENEEEGWDKKISAYIPDVVSGGPGFFLNPLALPMEYTHLIEGNLHRSGGDLSEALRRVAVSRLHAAARPAEMFLTRKDALGAKLRDGEVLPAMARALIPVPIGAVSPATAAKQLITGEPSERFPGQYQKQMLASFGMKTDQAPSAEQRIRNLAREFNREKGIVPSAEFFAGEFDDLNKALRIGNKTEARKALDELLTKKTARQVYDHYQRAAAAPFTGQAAREKEFWRGLTEEQRSQYLKARQARKETAKKAAEMLKAAR